jgi:hypothetical protein
VLFVVLAGLMLVTDPMGFLSTDVGGKIATLEAMDRSGSLSPDLGYWAEAADPEGALYPMFSTAHVDGKWINATSLPMLLIALPIYKVGGALAAGLIPVLGTLLAAFGARALAQRLGRDDQADGMTAFWIVGLASPATVYALDFWEHSFGLALILWAVAFVLDAAQGDGRARSALAAGLLFGIAAAMRQEALVYGFVAGGALGLRVLMSGRPIGTACRGAAMLAGLAIMTAANSLLESAIIGDATRTGRSMGTAARAGGDIGLRAEEAVLTFAAPFGRTALVYLVVAFITVGALVELGRRSAQMELPLRPVLLVLGSIGLLPPTCSTWPPMGWASFLGSLPLHRSPAWRSRSRGGVATTAWWVRSRWSRCRWFGLCNTPAAPRRCGAAATSWRPAHCSSSWRRSP